MACEWIPLTFTFNTGHLHLPRFVLGFVALFAIFGYSKIKRGLPEVRPALEISQFGWGFFAAHIAALLVYIRLSIYPFESQQARALVWCAAGAPAAAFVVFAFFPPGLLARLVYGARSASVLAALGIFALWSLGNADDSLWTNPSRNPFTKATFRGVQAVLGPVLEGTIADPSALTIGSPRFRVRIAAGCSGVEGLSLVLVFTGAWLWAFRREFRFPRALLLIPCALAVMWCANVIRISVLVLIGSAGYPGVAMTGFHSSAGWIAFTAVSFAFLVAAHHMPAVAHTRRYVSVRNPTAAYLAPFLMIVTAALISGSLSKGFEWLYPIRFIAAAAALWYFRREYRNLDWRMGWLAPAIGALVFLFWIGFDRWTGTTSEGAMAAGLAALPPLSRCAWLVFRVAAAVTSVPLAEELAFRGYAARRLMSADFEAVPFRALAPIPIILSSLVFGVLHGGHWFAGSAAGVAYAGALRRQGRIGDAVAAHATTNALLAIWVMARGAWHLW